MAYWLMKAEPGDYRWEDLLRDGTAVWDGVRNHQAARNMETMQPGERAFFYRSQQDPAVVGVMEIVRAAYRDPADPKQSYALVEVRPVMSVRREVRLQQIRSHPGLQHLAPVRQPRLSVSPIDADAWNRICQMADIEP